MKTILEIENLAVSFRTDRGLMRAVDGISLRVAEGEILGLVGESGCGKSVTSQAVLRLYDEKTQARVSGSVRFEGRELLSLSEKEMQAVRGKEITMVFQDALSALDPVFTVGSQITETLRIHQGLGRKEARERAVEMLRLVGIPSPKERSKAYPHQLSGGMRQRVCIAIALCCHPRLLIADEPTTALDVTVQAQIMELIARLNRELNMGVLLITHDLAVVAETCSRVAVMYLGQIVEEADVEELFDRPAHPYTQGLLRSVPDPEGDRRERLYVIGGSVPLLSQIPSGCRFAPRCPYAQARCRRESPPLRSVGGAAGHRARCWDRAPALEGGPDRG